jgi:hypothetical protein
MDTATFLDLAKNFGMDLLAFDGLHPWITRPIIGSLLVNNGLRYAWKKYEERPRIVNLIIGITDIPAFNFWAVAHWGGAKVGLDIKRPSDEVSTSAVQDAVKRETGT